MIGAATTSVNVMSARVCTCCTSFVVRVISDGAPSAVTSRVESDWILWKSALRTSRPTTIAVRAPKYTAPAEQMICTSVTASITPPVLTM